MWLIFLLSSFAFAIVALIVMYIGNKVINAMKKDDYKYNEEINKLYKQEKEKKDE